MPGRDPGGWRAVVWAEAKLILGIIVAALLFGAMAATMFVITQGPGPGSVEWGGRAALVCGALLVLWSIVRGPRR